MDTQYSDWSLLKLADSAERLSQIVTKVNAVNARVFITGTKPEPSTRLLWGVYRE
jgi:hypothetical protein